MTSNWRFTGKKKDISEYCDFLDEWSNNPDLPMFGGQPLTFGVTWSAVIFAGDTCEEGVGNCPIGAGIHSLRPGLNQLTDLYNKTDGWFDLPDVDQITVHAGIGFDHAPNDFPVGFPDTERNPFTLPQTLPLETIEIFFVAGSKRSSCEADVASNTMWLVTQCVGGAAAGCL